MTEARRAALAAAEEVITQTEINIKDLRNSLRQRVWEAAFDAASETPWQYRDTRQNRDGHRIANEVVNEMLGDPIAPMLRPTPYQEEE